MGHGNGMGWTGLALGLAPTAALLGAVATRFGGENPLGGAPDEDNWHHEGLTRRAARAAGWERPAENALAFHADYLDSYLYNPLWWFNLTNGGGLDRTKVVLSSRHELVKLHFDDLFDPEQVHASWRRYLSGTVAGLLWIGTGDLSTRVRVSMAHNVVGASLHAVQDFFSHSNWIDDEDRRDVTWFDVPDADRRTLPLWTGSYEEHDHLGHKPHGAFLFACTLLNNLGSFGRGLLRTACHAASPLAGSQLCLALRACDEAESIDVPDAWRGAVPDALAGDLVWVKPGINVDARWLADIGAAERGVPGLDGETAFSTAYGLAARASCQWLHLLEHVMADAGLGDFWADVKRLGVADADYVSDTGPWEDMALLPYRFISAGPYPPPADHDDEQAWYLRLTITTADVDRAGTNADIVAVVGGVDQPPLDHAPRAEPREPGEPPRRTVFDGVFSHDDFERSSTASYVLGPFEERPTSLALRNDAPDVGDVLLAALESIVDAVVDVLEAIGDFFLGLIGYHADHVDSAHEVFSAPLLNAMDPGERRGFTVVCDGGSEGHYRIGGFVEKTAVTGTTDGVPWREYLVRTESLHCQEESDWDRFSNSDEPFVLGLVVPHGGREPVRRWRTGPFSDVDSGDRRWINHDERVRITDTFGAITVAYAVYESDDESASDRAELLDQFAGVVESATEETEDAFLVTVSAAIAAGWRPSRVEAVVFRRGSTVEVCRYPVLAVGRWIDGGQQLDVPLDEPDCHRVEVPIGARCDCKGGLVLPDIDLPDLGVIDWTLPDLRRVRPRFDLTGRVADGDEDGGRGKGRRGKGPGEDGNPGRGRGHGERTLRVAGPTRWSDLELPTRARPDGPQEARGE